MLLRMTLALLLGFYLSACATGGESEDFASEEFGDFAGSDSSATSSEQEIFSELDNFSTGGSDGFEASEPSATNDEFGDFSGDSFTEDFASGDGFDDEFASLDEDFGEPTTESFDDSDFSELSGDSFADNSTQDSFGEGSLDDDFLSELEPAQEPTPEPALEELPSNLDEDIFAELEAPMEPAPPVAAPAPILEEEPFTPAPKVSSQRITNIEYRAGEQGAGTIVVQADGPLDYVTRTNGALNQFIIEVTGATLPASLQRPFDTSEFEGSVGALQAYQDAGSNLATIIVQMREGASMPMVEQEGQSLLVMTPSLSGTVANQSADEQVDAVTVGPGAQNIGDNEKILAARSLEEFLNENTRFYGKKISIETSQNMAIRDLFRLIAEEAGINLVIDDDVKGEVGLLKLRQVPWDQALHMIFKANDLGYSRQGNVLRIAQLGNLRKEEEEVQKMRAARIVAEPLKVQMIPISYAKVDDIQKQVQQFLTERGKAVGDPRTSALIVTDVEDTIKKVSKLVKSLDVAPPQVLIEGKIVEATDEFSKRIGVNWGVSGTSFGSGNPSFSSGTRFTPPSNPGEHFNFNFNYGTFPFLGDLNARLSLSEENREAKVISSPRIVTMHNETAEINQVQQIPLITIDEEGRRSVSFQPVNLALEVNPQITIDNSVILGVNVKREFAGAVVDAETLARPINARSAKTRVLVKNGDTAVIGGIYQNNAATTNNGIPGLKDLPFIGGLFRSTGVEKERTELLIFLTPRILGEVSQGTGKSAIR